MAYVVSQSHSLYIETFSSKNQLGINFYLPQKKVPNPRVPVDLYGHKHR